MQRNTEVEVATKNNPPGIAKFRFESKESELSWFYDIWHNHHGIYPSEPRKNYMKRLWTIRIKGTWLRKKYFIAKYLEHKTIDTYNSIFVGPQNWKLKNVDPQVEWWGFFVSTFHRTCKGTGSMIYLFCHCINPCSLFSLPGIQAESNQWNASLKAYRKNANMQTVLQASLSVWHIHRIFQLISHRFHANSVVLRLLFHQMSAVMVRVKLAPNTIPSEPACPAWESSNMTQSPWNMSKWTKKNYMKRLWTIHIKGTYHINLERDNISSNIWNRKL